MIATVPSFQICLLIFSTILITSNAKRNYRLDITDLKCTFNNEYVVNATCKFDKSSRKVLVETFLRQEVKKLRFGFAVYMRRFGSTLRNTLFKADDVDACDFLHENSSIPVFQMLKKVLTDPKNLVPDYCKVEKNYHLRLSNIYLDPEYLPAFVPEVGFVVNLVTKNMKTMFSNSDVFGRVSYIKKYSKNGKH